MGSSVNPLYLAKLCRLSYADVHHHKRVYNRVVSRSHTSILRKRNDCTIVATRGSKDFEHVWTNVDIRMTPWNETIGFHCGFYRAAQHLWEELRPQLIEGERLLFTGHSMGGPISVALAKFVCDHDLSKDVRVVTFGSPRYGSAALDPGFEVSNFVLEHDLVIQIPQHMTRFGETIVIQTDNLPNPYLPYGIVRYHSIENYIARMASQKVQSLAHDKIHK